MCKIFTLQLFSKTDLSACIAEKSSLAPRALKARGSSSDFQFFEESLSPILSRIPVNGEQNLEKLC